MEMIIWFIVSLVIAFWMIGMYYGYKRNGKFIRVTVGIDVYTGLLVMIIFLFGLMVIQTYRLDDCQRELKYYKAIVQVK